MHWQQGEKQQKAYIYTHLGVLLFYVCLFVSYLYFKRQTKDLLDAKKNAKIVVSVCLW